MRRAVKTYSTRPADDTISGASYRLQSQQQDEDLAAEFRRLRALNQSVFKDETIREQGEMLEKCFSAASRSSSIGEEVERCMEWLPALREHFRMTVEEMHRLEAEGGSPATKEQSERTEGPERTEGLLQIVRFLDKAILKLECFRPPR